MWMSLQIFNNWQKKQVMTTAENQTFCLSAEIIYIFFGYGKKYT